MSAVIKILSSGRMDRIAGLRIFLLLQLLDVVTTLAGLQAGLGEASPFIRYMMQLGPVMGLMASKIVAILLAGFCVWSGRHQVIRYVNFWYAAVVLWNLTLIITV